ncbi:hypothetical protein G7046_g5097 [Stylonectria norvegica]|nr:hypothetical protein G7046_g5097 [Stylonectria norvegica]
MEFHSSSNSTGELPVAVTQHKHIPQSYASNKPRPARRSRNHVIRAAIKRYAQNNNPIPGQDFGIPCLAGISTTTISHLYRGGEDISSNTDARRSLLEKDLRNELATNILPPRPRTSRARTRWGSDEDEGRDLAESAVPLPSDRFRIVRRPSLEREEAFRDANTAKGNVRLRRSNPLTEDAEVAELYSMGLLYDDDRDRVDGFDLNSIEHQEPIYSIRPAKRARKQLKARGYDRDQALHLNLSFTDLGGDDAIARFLMSSGMSEQLDDGTVQRTSGETPRSFARLRVIYELDSSKPSFDVDTSQPPDLVSDLLSDYDCFSDSEFDDLPSQREVRDSAATPASDAWIVLGDDS